METIDVNGIMSARSTDEIRANINKTLWNGECVDDLKVNLDVDLKEFPENIKGHKTHPEYIGKTFAKPVYWDRMIRKWCINLVKPRHNPINFCLTGDAGNGKTLSLINAGRFLFGKTPIIMPPLHDVVEILGYALGKKYYASLIASVIRFPGLVVFTEIFGSDEEVFTTVNTLAWEGQITLMDYSNGGEGSIVFPKPVVIKKHPQCILAFDDNTKGSGSIDGLYKRSQVDQSFINRLRMIHVDFDVKVATKLYGAEIAKGVDGWNKSCIKTKKFAGLRSFRDCEAIHDDMELDPEDDIKDVFKDIMVKNLSKREVISIMSEYDDKNTGFKCILNQIMIEMSDRE